jgi:hypothetical protein
LNLADCWLKDVNYQADYAVFHVLPLVHFYSSKYFPQHLLLAAEVHGIKRGTAVYL